MNILSEQQAQARQLSLPPDGLLTGVSPEFIAELQINGTFVEYNQQTIVNAGLPAEYIFCVISGRVNISRPNDDFGKSHVAALGPGQWYGVREVFLRVASEEEAFAEGEVILWTIPPRRCGICFSPPRPRSNCSSTSGFSWRKNWLPRKRGAAARLIGAVGLSPWSSREKLALHWRSFYRGVVEVFADSRAPSISRDSALARVTLAVRPQLEEVEARIARQAAAFDPAIEGYVTYAIGSRGKRLRPLMALLSGGASGGITSGHIDLAVIVELIHIATLVHDDIMDEAERRRAQPTVNARWGNSLSVLLGDCLFAQALNLSTNFDNAEISRVIARAAREVCSGEIIQTQRRFDLHLAIDDYLRIIEMKTGSLFAAAAELGAVLNGADLETTRALKNFGSKIGAAYQIYDDCLDIAGNETEIGKTLGTDLRKGKMTLPILMLLRSAPAEERERYCELILE